MSRKGVSLSFGVIRTFLTGRLAKAQLSRQLPRISFSYLDEGFTRSIYLMNRDSMIICESGFQVSAKAQHTGSL